MCAASNESTPAVLGVVVLLRAMCAGEVELVTALAILQPREVEASYCGTTDARVSIRRHCVRPTQLRLYRQQPLRQLAPARHD